MNKMKELQPIVKQLMEESQQAAQARMAEDFALLKQVLEIYDQKLSQNVYALSAVMTGQGNPLIDG